MPFSSSSLTSVASENRGGGCVKCCSGRVSSSLSVVALLDVGQRRAGLVLVGGVLDRLGVDREEAGELHHLAGRAQLGAARRDVDRRLVEDRRHHLARDEAVPDQRVEAQQIVRLALVAPAALAARPQRAHRLRVVLERRRPDRLVRVLRALLRLVDDRLGGQERRRRTSRRCTPRTSASASSEMRVESVRMYVMRPIGPSSPISTPS